MKFISKKHYSVAKVHTFSETRYHVCFSFFAICISCDLVFDGTKAKTNETNSKTTFT